MDLFVALGEDLGGGRWSIRAQLRPLIDYIWLAAGLMALGGALAARLIVVTVRGSEAADAADRACRGGARPLDPIPGARRWCSSRWPACCTSVSCHSPNKSTMESALLGKPAPAFELPVLGEPGRDISVTRSSPAGHGC